MSPSATTQTLAPMSMLFSPTPFARPAKPSTPNDERSATSRRPLPTATSAAPSDSWSEVPSERSTGRVDVAGRWVALGVQTSWSERPGRFVGARRAAAALRRTVGAPSRPRDDGSSAAASWWRRGRETDRCRPIIQWSRRGGAETADRACGAAGAANDRPRPCRGGGGATARRMVPGPRDGISDRPRNPAARRP